MAGTNFDGPVNSLGPSMGSAEGGTPAPDFSPEYGPTAHYGGLYLPDFRYAPFPKDNPQIGSFPGNFFGGQVVAVDALPSASNQGVTTAGHAVSGTTLPLITAGAAGLSLGIPFFPFGSQTLQSGGVVLDFGFSTINVSASSATATPLSGTLYRYYIGQWVIIDTAGNAGGTLPLIAQIIGISVSAGTVTLSTPALYSNSTAAIGQGNQFNFLAYGNPAAVAHSPRVAAGLAALLDPAQCITRGVGITTVSGATGGSVTISGYDMYWQPQSEVITAGTTATTVWGVKTYKAIISAVPAFSDSSHNYTVVTSDLFGFALFSDEYERTLTFFNGTSIATGAVTTTSAWTAGDQTSPATTATKDVRGTMQISARGPSTTPTSTTYPNGARRLTMFQVVSPAAAAAANLANPATLYGVTPV